MKIGPLFTRTRYLPTDLKDALLESMGRRFQALEVVGTPPAESAFDAWLVALDMAETVQKQRTPSDARD